jgi:isopenicillin N synthase-like dioxygenase
MATRELSIPVCSLDDFTSGGPARREAFVRTMGNALGEIGFFALVRHGVDLDLVQRAYGVADRVFALPAEVKRRYEDPGILGQRGYTPFGKEHAKDHVAPDLKEFWQVGRSLDPRNPMTRALPDNLWPVEVPEFREVFAKLFTQLEACSEEILRACALYLGEPERLLADMAHKGDTVFRIIHYPAIPGDAAPASVRAASHEDINFLTLLCAATSDGLELLAKDGSWMPIRATGDAIIVDTGDMMQNLTNGLLKSTTHRVVNPSDSRERRFSLPYFVHPRPEVDLAPLESCVARTGGIARYPKVTARALLTERLRAIGLGATGS